MPACPVCAKAHQPTDARCPSCGADLFDPDVRALATPAAGVETGPAGSLSAGKVLGISQEALADGSAFVRLGIGGAVILAAAWFLPLGQWRGTMVMAWDAPVLGGVSLYLPLVLAAAAVPFAAARRRLAPYIVAALFAGLGLLGFFLALFPIGPASASPSQAPPLTLGLLVAGMGVVARLHLPLSKRARFVLAGGAALVLLGYLVPWSGLSVALPGELRTERLRDPDAASSLLPVLVDLVGSRGGSALFVALFMLVPLVAAPAAAALAWRRPTGAWDKGGLALRPLAWLLVLYIPLFYALLVFNVWGAGSLSGAYLVARCRQMFLSLPFTMWTIFGAAGIAEERVEG